MKMSIKSQNNSMNKQEKNSFVFSSFRRIKKLLFITTIIYIYSLVNSFQNNDPPDLSDRLVDSVYFKGKKVNKISYEDLNNMININSIPSKNSHSQKLEENNKNNLQIKLNYTYTEKNKFDYYLELNENDLDIQEKSLFKATPFFKIYDNNNDNDNNKGNENNKEKEKEDERENFYENDNDNQNENKNFNSKKKNINYKDNKNKDNKIYPPYLYFLQKRNIPLDFSELNSFNCLGRDILEEVVLENIKENNNKFTLSQNENDKIFENNLYNFYNNYSNFKINNYDFEKLVDYNIISDIQANKFWEELIKINRNKLNPEFLRKSFSIIRKIFNNFFSFNNENDFKEKNKFNKKNINEKHEYRYNSINEADIYNGYNNHNFNNNDEIENDNNEIYIFNIFPTKSTGYFILACIIFIINYQLTNYFHKKESIFPSFNFLLTVFCLIICEFFYSYKIYLTSSIFLILFSFNLKYFIFSLINTAGFVTDDFDIFSDFQRYEENLQIFLQMSNLFICILLYGLLTFFRYNYILNYLFFYYTILQIPNIFITNYNEFIPIIFQPLRYNFIIIIGIINFFLLNYGKNKAIYTNLNNNNLFDEIEMNSFYLIGDLFTFFCFSYIFDYLFIQANNISILFRESDNGGFINKEKLNEKITNIIKNYKELIRNFSLDDNLWIICFIFGLFLQYTGLRYHKYAIYYLSYYYFRMILGVYGRLFNIRCIKTTYSILIFIFLITNFLMSSKVDKKLFNVKQKII
jgi:hypothetical protein